MKEMWKLVTGETFNTSVGSNIEGYIGFQKLQSVCVEKVLMNPRIFLIINSVLLYQYSELILLKHLRW